jgi:hypothetical protein
MATEATTFSGHIRGRDAGCKTFAKPNYQRLFHHFIEHSDCDEEILAKEEWINKLSIAIYILAFSLLFRFFPIF